MSQDDGIHIVGMGVGVTVGDVIDLASREQTKLLKAVVDACPPEEKASFIGGLITFANMVSRIHESWIDGNVPGMPLEELACVLAQYVWNLSVDIDKAFDGEEVCVPPVLGVVVAMLADEEEEEES